MKILLAQSTLQHPFNVIIILLTVTLQLRHARSGIAVTVKQTRNLGQSPTSVHPAP